MVLVGWGLLLTGAVSCVDRGPDSGKVFHILKEGRLGSGLDLGVDSSPRRQGWVDFDTDQGVMNIGYPAGTRWGAITFLLGLDDPAHRLTDDFGGFATLELVAAGRWGHPQPLTCGWGGTGLGVNIVGLASSPVPADFCNLDAPPLDAHGQECWLPPPLDGETFRTYRIPLGYLEAGQRLRDRLWSPAQLVLPDSDTTYAFQVRDIRLLPGAEPKPANPSDLCPDDCLCLTPACQMVCGNTEP